MVSLESKSENLIYAPGPSGGGGERKKDEEEASEDQGDLSHVRVTRCVLGTKHPIQARDVTEVGLLTSGLHYEMKINRKHDSEKEKEDCKIIRRQNKVIIRGEKRLFSRRVR